MIFKCDCCGHTADMKDGEEAFEKGWDAPPHFTGYVTCNLCPASTQFMEGGWARHAPIHEEWAKNGRPEEFSVETCISPEDRPDPVKMAALQEAVEQAQGKDPEEFIRAVLGALGPREEAE